MPIVSRRMRVINRVKLNDCMAEQMTTETAEEHGEGTTKHANHTKIDKVSSTGAMGAARTHQVDQSMTNPIADIATARAVQMPTRTPTARALFTVVISKNSSTLGLKK
ncbi:hypothetical protein Mal15_69260 [Stieleria maiorica]|uniref:Uncharacterized protein n=1 Tax=Stieleria maiorica TaxID=2795974 RepID=A0A5B9MS81_9BACT|nr:hypothetical protein Mal15_69260 [Stieleria maiorica]